MGGTSSSASRKASSSSSSSSEEESLSSSRPAMMRWRPFGLPRVRTTRRRDYSEGERSNSQFGASKERWGEDGNELT